MANEVKIRSLQDGDDLGMLTALIHAAYAPHIQNGLKFWGTHQTLEDTAERFASGQGFVAEAEGQLVGTITLRPAQPASPVVLYRNPSVNTIAQLAVLPGFKGRGIGSLLHEQALATARASGASTIALDTAAPAGALIKMYEHWGYAICGEHDWRPHTNYLSVLMARPIMSS